MVGESMVVLAARRSHGRNLWRWAGMRALIALAGILVLGAFAACYVIEWVMDWLAKRGQK